MRLMISGGGTGGHIYPALALIEQLKKTGKLDAVMYIGTERGLESRIVRDAGIPFKTLEIQGFNRRKPLANIKTVRLFTASLKQAKKYLREFKPDVVVGTGGYVSGSLLYAAARLHIPTVVHEQNSVAGVTNKFLARFVDKVAITFPGVASAFPKKKVVITGNPRAQQVADLQPNDRLSEFGLDPKKRTVMIFGGSRGAPMINRAARKALPAIAEAGFQVLFVTGRVHYDQVKEAVKEVPEGVAIVPYISDMPAILPDVSLIVGRSGATSLAELMALGIPSVLIPSPNVTHNHQVVNAQAIVDAGAAVVIPEQFLDDRFARRVIDLLGDDESLSAMAKAAKSLGHPKAADELIDVLEGLL